jgi:cell division protein FtsW
VAARGTALRSGRRRTRRRADRPLEYRMLLTATLCLLAAGAVMVYSASSARDLLAGNGDGSAFLTKYLLYGAAGLVVMHAVARMDLEWARRVTPILLAAGFAGVLLTKVPGLGVEVNGARRWLGAGPLQFQPAELLKLGLVLYATGLIAARPKRIQTFQGMVSPLLVVVAAACALVALQPDLGTTLVIAFAIAALLVAGGVQLRHLGLLAAAGGLLVLLFSLAEPYRRARLTSFLNPWGDAAGAGFQSVQGQIALGSGGPLGLGLGQSVQKVFYLPEAHTDFVLAVIGEELGVAGVCGLLFLYGMIAYAGLRAARRARGAYAKLLAAGITSLILAQAVINAFAVLGLAPLTGVPLPFISYGSTNLIVLLAGMGLLLNVAAGGRVSARALRPRETAGRRPSARKEARDAGDFRDRRRRDRRARRAGAGGRRRAAG